jgi:hypothetical protein
MVNINAVAYYYYFFFFCIGKVVYELLVDKNESIVKMLDRRMDGALNSEHPRYSPLATLYHHSIHDKNWPPERGDFLSRFDYPMPSRRIMCILRFKLTSFELTSLLLTWHTYNTLKLYCNMNEMTLLTHVFSL